MNKNGVNKLIKRLEKIEKKEKVFNERSICFSIDEQLNKNLDKVVKNKNTTKVKIYEDAIVLFCERIEGLFDYG